MQKNKTPKVANLIVPVLLGLFTSNLALAQIENPTSHLFSTCRSNDLTGVQKSLTQEADVNATDETGSTPLLCAVKNGNLEIIKLLLEKGANVQMPDSKCQFPVSLAAQAKNLEILKTLAQYGADLHRRYSSFDGEAQTLLHIAVQNNDIPMVQYLLDQKVSTETRDSDGQSALMLAADMNNLEMVKLLVNHGAFLYADADLGGPFVTSKAYDLPLKTKKYLQQVQQQRLSGFGSPAWQTVLKEGRQSKKADKALLEQYLQGQADLQGKDKVGRTLLHYAAAVSFNQNDLFEALITMSGMDVNAADIYGMTPLHLACQNDCVDNVKILLDHGADVNIRDGNGRTPLFTVAKYYFNGRLGEEEEVKIAQLLLDKGADVNAADAFGKTPLLCLAGANMDRHLGFTRLLIEHGADVNHCDNRGWTFLHEAADMGTATMMKLAIEAGADLCVRDYNGKSILDVARYDRQEKIDLIFEYKKDASIQQAIYFSQPEILDQLVQQGVDINMASDYDNGATGLIIASKQNDRKMLIKLLELRAAVNAQDALGNTALHYAAQKGYDDIVGLLLENGADITIRNKEGWRALDLAGAYNRYRVVQLFKDKYPDAEVSGKPVMVQQETVPDSQVEMKVVEQEPSEDQMQAQIIAELVKQVDRPLHKAVIQGNLQAVKDCLKAGSEDINGIDNMGSSALMYAVYLGHVDIAKFLIENGASVQFQNPDGVSILHVAVFSGCKELVAMLLDAGADPSVQTQSFGQMNVLEAAMMTQRQEIVELIRAKAPNLKADTSKFALMTEPSQEPAFDPNEMEDQMRQEEQKWYLSQTSKPLHIAVIKGQIDEVKKLLAAGADVHELDEAGMLPLSYAASMNNQEIVSLLLENGADINRLDSNVNFGYMGHVIGQEAGWGAIHYAIVSGRKAMLEFLIEKGADVNLADVENGESPIFLAVATDRKDILKVLIDAGANLSFFDKRGDTVLHSLARSNEIEGIRLLLDLGAKIDMLNKAGQTPLVAAAEWGKDDTVIFLIEHGADMNALNKKAGDLMCGLMCNPRGLETLRILIEYGIDINAKSSDGNPPLFCLLRSSYGLKDVRKNLQLLLNSGVDVNATDAKGNTMLHYAVQKCYMSQESSVELAQLMIDHGVDANRANADGQTPLDVMLNPYVHSCDSKELVRLLVENTTNLNTVDRYGRNTLHNAAFLGWADIVALLASKGADIENRQNDMQGGGTPLFSAIREKHKDAVKTLLELGADISALNRFKATPLIEAVQSKDIEIVQMLLDYQPDCNVQNDSGQTPLHIAVRSGNKEIVQLLLDAGVRTDIPDRSNKTAKDLAQSMKKNEIMELFR